ncbi:MAG TPA: biotin transporter BioY [Actinomycetota bacterium]|nr:biotin transporter BioY [Actinomycetota bacterium]
MTALAQTIARPRQRNARLAVDFALVVGGSLFIALLAQVTIPLPFTPVPITGQTLAVLVVGTAYGWRLAGLTVLLYLAQIAIGLPFAAEGRSGYEILTLATASGGYLWGFLLAGLTCGWLANRGWDRDLRSSITVMLLGSIVIYGVGVPWLAASIDVPLLEAFELGLYPFVIGDLLKLLVAAGVLPLGWRLAGRR